MALVVAEEEVLVQTLMVVPAVLETRWIDHVLSSRFCLSSGGQIGPIHHNPINFVGLCGQ